MVTWEILSLVPARAYKLRYEGGLQLPRMGCHASHSVELVLHHQTKYERLLLVLCWFRCIAFWEWFFLSCIHYDFSKHFNLSSIKSAFTFFYHQFIHCDFAKFWRLLDYFHCICSLLERGPKKAHSLNKSSVYFEASADSPHHWTEKVCIISPWYLSVLLCLMDSITLATVFLENLSKFCINLQRKSESHA